MLGRAIRRVGPLTYNFFKSTTFQIANHRVSSVSRHSVSCSKNVSKPRCYSQQATAGAEAIPLVDYEYVKKVTSSKDVIIIDVREPDEVKEHGKIPNSVNIPLGTITTTLSEPEKEFKETFNRDKPTENTEIIFYCMIGKRSGKAQQKAEKLGFKNAKNYMGSWTDWAIKSQ